MLVLLAILAALSVLASDAPRTMAWPLAALAAGHGLWLARREWRKPVRSLVISGDPVCAAIDGSAVHDFEVTWRGPLAFSNWRDGQGRRHRLAWWSDNLRYEARRELRLATAALASPRAVDSMAT